MGKLKFADHFWDDDFNGTIGYDTIINHMKDGKKFCDAYTDFLIKRAKLEEDYGRNLIKLGSQADAPNISGTMKTSWESLKRESENIGFCHMELGKRLNELVQTVQAFREKQKNERNKIDDKMKRLQKEKRNAYDIVLKSKKLYEQRCKESDSCKREYENKASYTPKEEDRLKKNIGKAKTNVENTDSSYQSHVKNLEDSRLRWLLEMEDSCNIFEQMEVDRIKFLRNQIWLYTNHGSSLAVEIDEKYESNRKVLENCDEVKDVQLFIQTKCTGTNKPAQIRYENYYHSNQPTNNMRHQSHPAQPRPMQEGAYSSIEDFDFSKVKAPTSKNPLMKKNSNSSSYANVGGRYVVASFDYVPQGPQELELKTGDKIEVLRVEDTDWGIGKLRGNTGAFPLSFTEPQK